ncbi:MAG: UDP-3-O-acyl-N-acetylglucosamine deacetylase [Methyloligellaceae bacterium]
MGKGFIGARQTTLNSEIVLNGIGVHSGAPASIILHPADVDTGIRFHIVKGSRIAAEIVADHKSVSNVTLCTVLSDGNGASVATVEHLLAAIRGLSIDNIVIEIDSGEVPIMDGSSVQFVEAIDETGIRLLDSPRRFVKILETIRIKDGKSIGELRPYSGFQIDVEIDFDTPVIGHQRYIVDVNPGVFRSELARARTFGFMDDVERLWAAGRALGASLENTVAIGKDRIINPEGLRFADEFVRHKALDAIGDLALAGAPIIGAFRSVRGGHWMNSKVLSALFANKDAWTLVEAPRVRDTGHVDLGYGVAVANYAADRS